MKSMIYPGTVIKISYQELLPADCIVLANSGNETEVLINEQPHEGSKLNMQVAHLLNFDSKNISNLNGSIDFDSERLFSKK